MKTINIVPTILIALLFLLISLNVLIRNNNLTTGDSSAAPICGNMDIDGNNFLGITDFSSFANAYHTTCSDSPAQTPCGPKDSNGDKIINVVDFGAFAQMYKIANCGKSIPSVINLKVMNVTYYGGQSPTSTFDYQTLVNTMVSTLTESSAFRKYKNSTSVPSISVTITKNIVLNKAPTQKGTNCDQYLPQVQNGTWTTQDWQTTNCWGSGTADYNSMLTENQVCEALNAGQIDEVWFWGFGNAGFWESIMTGPNAFWTNGPVLANTTCQKSMHIMGLNYQLDVGYAMHSYGHRTESTIYKYLPQEFGPYTPSVGKPCNWGVSNCSTPTFYACGNVHFPPNGVQDYDYGNSTPVSTDCMDWTPARTGQKTTITCSQWGCSQTGYMKWWFQSMPGYNNGLIKIDGTPMPNWWTFILNKV